MPALVVSSVHISQAVAEIAVVIFGFRVMHLQPDPRHIDCVNMRRKPAVSFVYVRADILDAGDHVVAVFFRLAKVAIAKLRPVDRANLSLS